MAPAVPNILGAASARAPPTGRKGRGWGPASMASLSKGMLGAATPTQQLFRPLRRAVSMCLTFFLPTPGFFKAAVTTTQAP